MLSIHIDEILIEEAYLHLDVSVFRLPVGAKLCDAKFKIFVTNGASGLEFRTGNGWPVMFAQWPSQTEDAYGFVFKAFTREPDKVFVAWFDDDAGVQWELDDYMHLVEVKRPR